MNKIPKFKKRLFFCSLLFVFAPGVWAMDMAEKDLPVSLRILLHKSQSLMEKQEYEKAIENMENFRRSRKNGAGHYLLDFMIGNAFFQEGNLKEAAQNYGFSVSKNSDFSDGWLNLARCRYDLSQFGKAGDAFLKGYETAFPKDPDSLYYAALSFITAGNAPKAVLLLEKLLREYTSGNRIQWQETLVHAYLTSGKTLKALPVMKNLVEKFTGEKKLQWQENLLYQYLSADMKKKALHLAEDLTRDHPEVPKWWKALAHVHLSQAHYRKALVALTIYSYLEHPDETEKKLLADLSLMTGIPQKAAQFYESLEPPFRSGDIIEKIVQCYLLSNQFEEALKWVSIGLGQQETADLLALKGNLLFQLKRFSEAITVFERLTKRKGPDQGRSWLMIGYASRHLDDLERAKIAFQKASGFKEHRNIALSNLKLIDDAEKVTSADQN